MNFDDMPELHWQYGYPTVLLVIAVAARAVPRVPAQPVAVTASRSGRRQSTGSCG